MEAQNRAGSLNPFGALCAEQTTGVRVSHERIALSWRDRAQRILEPGEERALVTVWIEEHKDHFDAARVDLVGDIGTREQACALHPCMVHTRAGPELSSHREREVRGVMSVRRAPRSGPA